MAVHAICNVGYVPSIACFYDGGMRYCVCPPTSKAHAAKLSASVADGLGYGFTEHSPSFKHKQGNPCTFSAA